MPRRPKAAQGNNKPNIKQKMRHDFGDRVKEKEN
jgi:hypothetical protein